MIDLNPHQLRVVAAAACCHPATVKRFLDDRPIRSTCRERIEKALASIREGTVAPSPTKART